MKFPKVCSPRIRIYQIKVTFPFQGQLCHQITSNDIHFPLFGHTVMLENTNAIGGQSRPKIAKCAEYGKVATVYCTFVCLNL
jgi:hypothetical protein